MTPHINMCTNIYTKIVFYLTSTNIFKTKEEINIQQKKLNLHKQFKDFVLLILWFVGFYFLVFCPWPNNV